MSEPVDLEYLEQIIADWQTPISIRFNVLRSKVRDAIAELRVLRAALRLRDSSDRGDLDNASCSESVGAIISRSGFTAHARGMNPMPSDPRYRIVWDGDLPRLSQHAKGYEVKHVVIEMEAAKLMEAAVRHGDASAFQEKCVMLTRLAYTVGHQDYSA